MTREFPRRHRRRVGTALTSLSKSLRREFRKHPVASVSASVALFVALISLVAWGTAKLTQEELRAHISPFEFNAGQWTAPSMVIPEELAESGFEELLEDPATDLQQLEAWFAENQAVYAATVAVSFIVRSDSTEPIVILDARVNVLQRQAPIHGTWIDILGAGPGPNRVLYANLDEDPPSLWTDGAWAFPLQVSNTDIEGFTVVAVTEECHCYWQVEIDYMNVSGELSTLVIENDGIPFELTATRNARHVQTQLLGSPG